MDKWMYRRKDGWINGWIEGRMDKWMVTHAIVGLMENDYESHYRQEID